MATQQESKHEITSQTGKGEYLIKTIDLMTECFHGDPVFAWFLSDYPLEAQKPYLKKLLRGFFTAGALNKGIFVEADNFGSCGLLMPPGCKPDNTFTMVQAGIIPLLCSLGVGFFKRVMLGYSPAVHALLPKAGFTKEEQRNHWYVFIMGTALEKRRQGLAGELLVYFQNLAKKDGRPIWLEATTATSRDLYLKHGFVDVGEVVLGKGTHGGDGLKKKGGEGVVIWGMYWRPS
ncbi:putative increased recombination centers protein 11 [Podospora australis]|uniref:Increased recombination centers protein 11 n=1 Tax=Podospora australis TaxID=1536484 RepID=A0AAN6WPQ8_9PEZI|nr:putative increased recombination centers protein 11 [Podospora australis]